MDSYNSKKFLNFLANVAITVVWVIIFFLERTNPGLFNQSIWLVAIPMIILYLIKKGGMTFIQYLLTIVYSVLVVVTQSQQIYEKEIVLYPIITALVIINITPLINQLCSKNNKLD